MLQFAIANLIFPRPVSEPRSQTPRGNVDDSNRELNLSARIFKCVVAQDPFLIDLVFLQGTMVDEFDGEPELVGEKSSSESSQVVNNESPEQPAANNSLAEGLATSFCLDDFKSWWTKTGETTDLENACRPAP